METADGTTNREEIRQKLKTHFPGKIVRKDLTKKNQRRGQCPCVRLGISIRSVLQL